MGAIRSLLTRSQTLSDTQTLTHVLRHTQKLPDVARRPQRFPDAQDALPHVLRLLDVVALPVHMLGQVYVPASLEHIEKPYFFGVSDGSQMISKLDVILSGFRARKIIVFDGFQSSQNP